MPDFRDYAELSDVDVERIFHSRPEPRWLMWCRLHEREIGDAAALSFCGAVIVAMWLIGVFP